MVDFRINVVVDPRRAELGTKRVGKGLDSLDRQANNLRATLVRTFAVLASAGVAFSAIRTLANFGQEMSTVRAITGATEKQFAALSKEAKRLGATTRFSATQAAEGMTFLARAGFEVDEVLASISDTLKLAQAGGLELGKAADIASNVLQGFRLEADEAGRAVDVLALAAASANTTVEQLGEGLKFVAPIAAGLNITLEETTAAMAALSDAGLQGTLAGTGLRRVLSELESPAKKTRSILKRIGVELEDVRPSTVGLTDALVVLEEAGINTGEALEIFGDRGGPAFEVLSNSIPKVIEMTDALGKADGTALRIATTMDDNLQGALLAVKSAFEAVILEVGETSGATQNLEDGLRGFAGFLRDIAADTSTLIRAFEVLASVVLLRLVPAFIALTRAMVATPIGALVTGVGLLLPLINRITGGAGEAAENFSEWADVSDPLAKNLQATATAIDGINSKKLFELGVIIDQFGKLQTRITPVERPEIPDLAPPSIGPVASLPGLTIDFEGFFALIAKGAESAAGGLKDFGAETVRTVQVSNQLFRALEQENELLQAQATGSEELVRRKEIEIQLRNAGIIATKEEIDQAVALVAENERLRQSMLTFANGVSAAFEKIRLEAQDLAAVGEDVVNVFADRATDALIEFARTGQLSFKEFASAIIDDLIRIAARLLVVQAISAFLPGAAPLTGAAGGIGAGLIGRQEGGPVSANQPVVVGEAGPELFVPNRGGQVVPSGALAAAVSEPPKVTIINSIDPDQTAAEIDSGDLDEPVLNVIGRNPAKARSLMGF